VKILNIWVSEIGKVSEREPKGFRSNYIKIEAQVQNPKSAGVKILKIDYSKLPKNTVLDLSHFRHTILPQSVETV